MGPVVAPCPGLTDDPARIAERVGESLTRLARVTGRADAADTVDSVVKIVTYHMADAVGATIAAHGPARGRPGAGHRAARACRPARRSSGS